MNNIRTSIDLVQNDAWIKNQINKELKKQLDIYLDNALKKIKPQIIQIVSNAITSSPEYNSLLNGDLKYEFGLPDSDTRLEQILKFWTKLNIEYNKFTINSDKLSGGFSINMIDSTYADVLSSSAAIFVTEKRDKLAWLEWLLLLGNKTIIKDYVVQMGYNPKSRTGRAIMKGVLKGKWSVPAEYAGTINDNWITRAIDGTEPKIKSVFLSALRV